MRGGIYTRGGGGASPGILAPTSPPTAPRREPKVNQEARLYTDNWELSMPSESRDDTREFLSRLSSPYGTSDRDMDLSGLNVRDHGFEKISVINRIFNGCSFKGCAFREVDARHCEFAEAQFEAVRFLGSGLDHSDFVSATFNKCVFERCSFVNGEWRGSEFMDCTFVDCNFLSTTVGHCVFRRCDFDAETAKSFVGRSKRYNVFVDTRFPLPLDRTSFLENNLGLKGSVQPHHEAGPLIDPLHRLSQSLYAGETRPLEATKWILEAMDTVPQDNLASAHARLKYIAIIVGAVPDLEGMAPIHILFLSDQILLAVNRLHSHAYALEVLGIVLHIRATLLEKLEEIRESLSVLPSTQESGTSLMIVLDDDGARNSADALVSALAILAGTNPKDCRIRSVKNGSTVIDVALGAPLVMALWLKAFNLLFAEVLVSLRTARAIRAEWKGLKKTEQGPQGQGESRAPPGSGTSLVPVSFSYIVGGFDSDADILQMRQITKRNGEALLSIHGSVRAQFSIYQEG